MTAPTAAPVITFNQSTGPYTALTSLALTGSGPSSSIISGSTSNATTIRIYNNFASAVNISDALGCTLTTYDDAVTPGNATTTAVSAGWTQVQVLDYNSVLTGADVTYASVGGFSKHAVPTNSGTLAGSGTSIGTANSFIEVSVRWVVPLTAASTSVTMGLWSEYSYI